jgi:hypothetical protein
MITATCCSQTPLSLDFSEMGNDTKNRLQSLATQWSTRFAGSAAGEGGGADAGGNGVAGAYETRGLLDSDDGEEMEMSFASSKPKNN